MNNLPSAIPTVSGYFMKTLLFIVLIFIYSSCNEGWQKVNNNLTSTLSKSGDTSLKKTSLLIKPGIGIDNIVLYKSKIQDILKFKNLHYVVDSGESITNGINWACHTFWKSYYAETSGVDFKFSSECFNEPNSNPKTYSRSLTNILIQNNNSACFENGLCIGKASYNDIVKAFGPLPKNWKNEHFIDLQEKGISLSFDDNMKLFKVEIYKPKGTNNR